MKFKTDKTQWLAWLGLMVEYVFAFAFSQHHAITLVLLYFVLAGAINFVLVHFWSIFTAGKHSLLLIVWPVVGIMAFADLVFGFNVVFPFIVLTVLALAGSVLVAAADKPNQESVNLPAVLLIALATVGAYLLLTMPYGIFS